MVSNDGIMCWLVRLSLMARYIQFIANRGGRVSVRQSSLIISVIAIQTDVASTQDHIDSEILTLHFHH
jgi:hypothetical protein